MDNKNVLKKKKKKKAKRLWVQTYLLCLRSIYRSIDRKEIVQQKV
jgi:hypothetical protein